MSLPVALTCTSTVPFSLFLLFIVRGFWDVPCTVGTSFFLRVPPVFLQRRDWAFFCAKNLAQPTRGGLSDFFSLFMHFCNFQTNLGTRLFKNKKSTFLVLFILANFYYIRRGSQDFGRESKKFQRDPPLPPVFMYGGRFLPIPIGCTWVAVLFRVSRLRQALSILHVQGVC